MNLGMLEAERKAGEPLEISIEYINLLAKLAIPVGKLDAALVARECRSHFMHGETVICGTCGGARTKRFPE